MQISRQRRPTLGNCHPPLARALNEKLKKLFLTLPLQLTFASLSVQITAKCLSSISLDNTEFPENKERKFREFA